MKRICYIIGALPTNDIFIDKACTPFVIAADGGLTQLDKLNIVPDLVVGDFDSLEYEPSHIATVKLPCEKDDTDLFRAAREALLIGCDLFYLYGGLGGRLDHTLANLQLLSFLTENGAKGFLFGEGLVATVIKNSAIHFAAKKDGIVSVFSFSDTSEGVSIKGLKYPLDNVLLTSSFPVGISNEHTGNPATISVKKGSLLVLWEDSAKNVISEKSIQI